MGGGGVVSAELEEALKSRKLWTATRLELRYMVPVALPITVIITLSFLMPAIIHIPCGHLGNMELAAASLGLKSFLLLPNGLMRGMVGTLETLCNEAYKAKKYEMLGIYLQRSTIILTATGIPITMIYIFSKEILLSIGLPYEIASPTALFVYGLIPLIFALACLMSIQRFLVAQRVFIASTYIMAATAVIHAVLTWVALFKLGLGLLGASLVLSFSWWFIVVAQFVYILVSERFKHTWSGFSWAAFSGLGEFVCMPSPLGVVMCFEVWHSMILLLIAGFLDNPQLALNSLAICITLNGWLMLSSYGFNAAVSIRVRNELEAGHPKSASFSAVVTTTVSLLYSIFLAILVLIFRNYLSYIFTNGVEVSDVVADLSPYLALSVIIYDIDHVLCGAAIGCGWKEFVGYVYIGCHCFVGISLGILLGFYFDLGVKGIWSGMLGGVFLDMLILIWVICRTDWQKVVEIGAKRQGGLGDERKSLHDE